jgi:flagellar protein FliO/FliZ
MNLIGKTIVWLILIGFQQAADATEQVATTSPAGGLAKMSMGLAIVLGVMALIAWGVKRLMPGGMGQQSVVRVVGGASVGARERVVVLEIAGRWIVVGVAPGQVNRLANLEASNLSAINVADNAAPHSQSVHPVVAPLVKPFSEWLKKSAEKIKSS